jgi:hypothetical protein
MCGRVRLANDYSEIKIRLKFAPDASARTTKLIYKKLRGPFWSDSLELSFLFVAQRCIEVL